MARSPNFYKVLAWTVVPIAIAYAVIVVLNAMSEHSGKMQLTVLMSLLVPASLFAFLIGLAAFLPGAISCPDRGQSVGLWAMHFFLSILLSVCIMVVCGIFTVVTS